MMMTERGLAVPAAGGVAAVAFDADSGGLDIVPDASAYGTKLRRSAQALVAAAGVHVPDANVRTLPVLPSCRRRGCPRPVPDLSPAAAPEPTGPVCTREHAPDTARRSTDADMEEWVSVTGLR